MKRLEEAAKSLEFLFQPRPVEVRVPLSAWKKVDSRFKEGKLIKDEQDGIVAKALLNSALAEAGLKKYFVVSVGENAVLEPKPDFDPNFSKIESKDNTTMVLRFTRARAPVVHDLSA